MKGPVGYVNQRNFCSVHKRYSGIAKPPVGYELGHLRPGASERQELLEDVVLGVDRHVAVVLVRLREDHEPHPVQIEAAAAALAGLHQGRDQEDEKGDQRQTHAHGEEVRVADHPLFVEPVLAV